MRCVHTGGAGGPPSGAPVVTPAVAKRMADEVDVSICGLHAFANCVSLLVPLSLWSC